MKIAVISDIHGNYEALKSVVKDMEEFKIEKIIALGDLVGYGPEPEKIINFIRKNKIPSVMGNHELAVFDNKELGCLNEDAHNSILLTRKLLSKESIDYIKKLPVKLIENNILFIHGCPPDSISGYIFMLSDKELVGIFKKLKQKVVFVGNTHEIKLYSYNGKKITKKYFHKGRKRLDKTQKHIINAGSVGQPRDENNNAKYIIFDNNEFSIDVRFVPYNIKKTVDLIKKRGFPKFNAERLV